MRPVRHRPRRRPGHPAGQLLDVPDPDGTVLRFYNFTDPTEGFTGVQFRNGRHVGNYSTPRLG